MTGPVAMFGDAQAEACIALRAALAGRAESYVEGVEVGGRVPWDRDVDAERLPFVVVRVDGTPSIVYPIVARSTVRVTVWHRTDDDAHDLASLCLGLLAASSSAVVASYLPLTGPFRAVDPVSGCDLASFTVRATVRGSLA
jgi:hypothetical protein